jgi:hypothetical protein
MDIRLSYVYPVLFVLFFVILWVYHRQALTPGQLALFSANSFLFGYYFGPILNAQKGRVDTLSKSVRQEEMTMLDILAQSHLLKPKERHDLKLRLKVYLHSVIRNDKVRPDNPYYDELLRFTKQGKFSGNSVMDVIYNRVAKTQENRDAMQNAYQTTMYSHEWLVLFILFFITLYFILQIDYGHSIFFQAILALLCTGLCLLVLILVKYATLTHKSARKVWEPLAELNANHFDDIADGEMMVMKREIDAGNAR